MIPFNLSRWFRGLLGERCYALEQCSGVGALPAVGRLGAAAILDRDRSLLRALTRMWG